MLYSEEPNVFLLQEKKDAPSQFKIIFQTTEESQISSKDLNMLSENEYHLYPKQSYLGLEGNLLLTANSWGKENNVIYHDSFGNKYCTTGINLNGKVFKISKILILYLCYYVFSMLVRYYPDLWMKFCNSKDIAIISKLMTGVKNISLIEILQLLNDEEYIFSSKLPSLDKDLDYSDILKHLLEEIRHQNRRRGKSILSDLI